MLETHPASLELLYNVLLDSHAGAMLLKVLTSLLLLPGSYMKYILPHLIVILEPLDRLNRLMPIGVQSDSLSGLLVYFLIK